MTEECREAMCVASFAHSTARVAAWNLAGYGGIPEARLQRQVEGLALLDAEVVALVEINPHRRSKPCAKGSMPRVSSITHAF